ncbi:MAG: hypothetical protein P4L77_11270 [Sulfuriferula sp.]|nr:hypothetical protein [Sulfuriferula sp.]
MSNTVRYGCTSLVGTNKAGLLKPDGNGYYPMVVGALKMYNSAGEFYNFEEGKQVFDSSSHLQRRVARGVLKGEYGHPKMEVGMRPQQFAQRVLTIDEDKICCHFREIWLDTAGVKDKDGKAVVAIMAWVRPSGPYGQYLRESIENKDENVCFSIRAFTDDKMIGTTKHRILKTVVTFDHVLEPGMAVAEKYKAPALESFNDQIITRGEFEMALKETAHSGIAMESNNLAVDLFNAMGWVLPKNVTPVYARWN